MTMPKRFVGGKAKDNGPRGKKGTAPLSSSSSETKKTIVSGPHANVYRSATALECLVGYLYVTDPPRLHAVMRYVGLGGPEGAEGEAGLAAAVLAAAAIKEGSAVSGSNSSGNDDDEEEDSNESTSSSST